MCELLTQEALQAKMQETDAAMAQLTPLRVQTPGSETPKGGPLAAPTSTSSTPAAEAPVAMDLDPVDSPPRDGHPCGGSGTSKGAPVDGEG